VLGVVAAALGAHADGAEVPVGQPAAAASAWSHAAASAAAGTAGAYAAAASYSNAVHRESQAHTNLTGSESSENGDSEESEWVTDHGDSELEMGSSNEADSGWSVARPAAASLSSAVHRESQAHTNLTDSEASDCGGSEESEWVTDDGEGELEVGSSNEADSGHSLAELTGKESCELMPKPAPTSCGHQSLPHVTGTRGDVSAVVTTAGRTPSKPRCTPTNGDSAQQPEAFYDASCICYACVVLAIMVHVCWVAIGKLCVSVPAE
jgi:hypothetical protein